MGPKRILRSGHRSVAPVKRNAWLTMGRRADKPIGGQAMAWVQAHNAQFGKPLVNQLIAIIQRDQAAALTVVNAARAMDGNQPLGPIAEFHKGPGVRTGWPWLC